jgi:hypothetical protein
MRKRAGRKEYKEKDREDGGRMVKRRWRGRRDTRGIHYLSSLSCNIIIHLITSVFLPSPSSLFNSS